MLIGIFILLLFIGLKKILKLLLFVILSHGMINLMFLLLLLIVKLPPSSILMLPLLIQVSSILLICRKKYLNLEDFLKSSIIVKLRLQLGEEMELLLLLQTHLTQQSSLTSVRRENGRKQLNYADLSRNISCGQYWQLHQSNIASLKVLKQLLQLFKFQKKSSS